VLTDISVKIDQPKVSALVRHHLSFYQLRVFPFKPPR